MRISHAPRVHLIARPALELDGIDAVLAEYGPDATWQMSVGTEKAVTESEGDSLAEFMGRLCYGSFGAKQGRRGAPMYHQHILEAGHGSILEHANFSFVVCGTSRGFTHQMIRHRAGFAYSQESQHFVRYSNDDEPGAQEACACLCGLPKETHDAMMASVELAIADYTAVWKKLKASGLSKKEACERARGLLPGCLESRLGFTANARALRHFVELRGAEGNILEIRIVAALVARIMKQEAPAMFQDIDIQTAADDWPMVVSAHRKV